MSVGIIVLALALAGYAALEVRKRHGGAPRQGRGTRDGESACGQDGGWAQLAEVGARAEVATAGLPGAPQAGWYADPEDSARYRYWDGAAWTDQIT